MRIGIIIAAAGKGERLGKGGKALRKLGGRYLVEYSLSTFQRFPRDKEIILVVQSSDLELAREFLIPKYNVKIIPGGKERYLSVYNGFKQLSSEVEKVLIHDCARPFLSFDLISRVIAALDNEEAVVPALPVKDTIKVELEGYIKETLPRSELLQVQTPQGFRREVLAEAYLKLPTLSPPFLDDAILVEQIGKKVKIIPGDEMNFKITTPLDWKLAEVVLKDGI